MNIGLCACALINLISTIYKYLEGTRIFLFRMDLCCREHHFVPPRRTVAAKQVLQVKQQQKNPHKSIQISAIELF